MVECPYCGSTAQVKTAPTAEVSKDKKWLVLNCKCGCGCEFVRQFVFDKEYIVNDEKRSE